MTKSIAKILVIRSAILERNDSTTLLVGNKRENFYRDANRAIE